MNEIKVEASLKELGEKALASKVNLDYLMPIIGDKLEREALERFRHNDEWAIRGVIYDSRQEADPSAWDQVKEKFRQEIAQELTPDQLEQFPTEDILDGLPGLIEDYVLGMVRLYQKETFDPLASFEKRLAVQNRSMGTIKEYLNVAGRFVAKYGRKRSYEDTEIMDFLYGEQKRVGANTYCSKVAALKVFIGSIERGRVFPIDVPTFKGETYSPLLSKDQVDALILAGCIFLHPVDLLRLATMTIYLARVGEVANLGHRQIDLPNKTITVPVSKRERARPQPIPDFLMQVFSAPIRPCSKTKLEGDLKRWCKLAGFRLPRGVGVHAIRRTVATALDEAGVGILELGIFGRWSTSRLGTAVSYIKTPKEAKDSKVLEVHPFVQTWKEALELRFEFAKMCFRPIKE